MNDKPDLPSSATIIPYRKSFLPSGSDLNAIAVALYEQALLLASWGLPVFPLKFGAKTPALQNFSSRASCCPDAIRNMWFPPMENSPAPFNIGIATGNGLFVVDIDDKNGKQGSVSWAALERQYGASPPTFTVRTPSGGRHLYFRADPGLWIPNSAGKLGVGIDIRGEGGYVVGPGSVLDGRQYVRELN